ncbi:hypothetical protein MKW98_017274 [Papaver atlanticum]|uniref:Morc S5 domain-containing protein n=1 Tax=Papaver atlanticum TaxID=357466 RepID=A0AAD4S3S4_9MAGN|nr:hypothetical protein MKW98_017274 [Papaver atlanticum]
MAQKIVHNPVDVVELMSSSDDDDDGNGGRRRRRSKNEHQQQEEQPLQSIVAVEVSDHEAPNQTWVCRSFWKAGDYQVQQTKSAPPQGQLEHVRVHPKFLHSNATSHKWAFGAIAELLDNAVDEISSGATFVKVDEIWNERDNSPALLFLDNGGGMDPESMRQCMSLGYSSKKANTTIGQYGNGFKTSTMRLGSDVIVFSRAVRGSHVTQSIGLLSYTFLWKTGQDDVIVPMVDFKISGSQAHSIVYGSEDDWSSNLNLILEWSPFASQNELMQQFDDIGVRGTKIIIYNLWLDDDGFMELDFNNDKEDICLRDEFPSEKVPRGQSYVHNELKSHISYQFRFSLRAYASILYLRKFTDFNIIIRGKPVQQYIIAENLNITEMFKYRPKLGIAGKEVSVETTMGFVKESPLLGVTGFNVYHKNRLIRPFWKVTADHSSQGRCAVGVLEANFIEPAHDKQDFERSAQFLRLETWLRQLIVKYWANKCHLAGFWSPIPETRSRQKELSRKQPIYRNKKAGLRKEWPSHQHDIDVSDYSVEEIYLDQPAVVGLAAIANIRHAGGDAEHIAGVSMNSHEESPTALQPSRQEWPSYQHDIDLSNYSEEIYLDLPAVIGLAATANARHEFSNAPSIVAVARHSHVDPSPAVGLVADSSTELSINWLAATGSTCTNGDSLDGSSSRVIDQLCEENLKLFMRCDEHRQNEIALKNTVEDLEGKLLEAKSRRSQISLYLEAQKKQVLMGHQEAV